MSFFTDAERLPLASGSGEGGGQPNPFERGDEASQFPENDEDLGNLQKGISDTGRNGQAEVARDPLLSCEAVAKAELTPKCETHERTPDGVGQAMVDEKTPEPVGALVEDRHQEVGQYRRPLPGPSRPD